MANRYIIDGELVSADVYNRVKYDSALVRLPKGDKAAIQAAAAAAGMSTNAYILEAIREKMTRNAPESVSNAAHTSTESPTERDSAPGVDVPGTPGNAAESG